MDKLLLAAFLSSIAGFITAAISVVKLVNEKENKTSEFRQAWTNSIRTSISDLAAKLVSVTAAVEYQKRLMEIESKLMQKTGPIYEKRLESIRATLLQVRETITSHRHDQYQSYAQCKLHFKPDDQDFQPIEEIFNSIVASNKTILDVKNDNDRIKIKENNHELIQEMLEISRGVLKKEWERVKKGENVYILTKRYSFIGGIVMLGVLLLIGGYAFYLAAISDKGTKSAADGLKNETKIEITKCWQLQNFGRRIFKLNSCTGEIVELNNTK